MGTAPRVRPWDCHTLDLPLGATRRRLAAALTAAPAALTACATGAPGEAPREHATKQPVKLRLLTHNTAQKEVFERHFPEHLGKHPHVDLEYIVVRDSEVQGKLTTLFVAGDGPELSIPFSGDSAAFLDRGWAAEVEPRSLGLNRMQSVIDAYAWPSALDAWKWKGKYYGLPTEISNYCLYVNNRLFRQAGLDPQTDSPRDWDQMVEVGRRLTRREGGEYVQRGFDLDYRRVLLHWGGHAYQLTGPFLSEDGKVAINTPGAERTLQYWADWGQKHQLGGPDLPGAEAEFRKETVAMWISGSWYAPGVRRSNPALFADMTVRPFPRWKDKKHDHGTHVYGYAFLVSGQAKPEARGEAWRLAWHFSGYAADFMAHAGLLIPRRDFVETPAFKNFPDIPSLDVFLEDMKKSTYHAKTTAYTEVSDALRVHMERAWRAGQPAKQVLPELQRELERLVVAARPT